MHTSSSLLWGRWGSSFFAQISFLQLLSRQDYRQLPLQLYAALEFSQQQNKTKKSTLASHDASPRELPLAKSSLLAQSPSISKPAVAQLEQLTALRVTPEEAKEIKKACFYFGLFQFCFLFDLHLGPCVPQEGVCRAPGQFTLQLHSSQPGKLFHLHCELSPHLISTL